MKGIMKQFSLWLVAVMLLGAASVRADGNVDKGKELVAGAKPKCSICHGPGKAAKPLAGIAEGKTDEFLKGALLTPKETIKPDTKMPKYKFTGDEVADVIAYLKSLKK